MAEPKTKQTNGSVAKFVNAISDDSRRRDAKQLIKIFREVTGAPPKMWGPSIIGFGSYSYRSSRSACHGEWFYAGFSPRKDAFSIYVMSGFKDVDKWLVGLGKFKRSSGCCLYIKKLGDVNISVFKKLLRHSVSDVKKHKGVF